MATTSTIDKAPRSAVVESNRKSGRILMAAALAGLALGAGTFGLTRQPDLEVGGAEREAAHWQAVTSYYEAQYWARLTPAEREAAHWRAVIEQYERQWPAANR